MDAVRRWRHGRWTVPVLSGALIVVGLLLSSVLDLPRGGDALLAVAAVVAGVPVAVAAVRSLGVAVVGIDLLVSVAATGALLLGDVWEAAAVTFLFAVGHALEAATLDRTRSALADLVAVAPDVAVVLRDGEQVEVPARTVVPGETVLVKNGAQVPVDGVVTDGTGALDEASITGEAVPAAKEAGDQVFAGTVSAGGFLHVRATGVGADTTLARIVQRVEEAQDARARTQTFMDRFSAWYTPAIIALAGVAGLLTGDVELALTLLVIGCPGALVISVPVTMVAGIGRGARDGILVKGGEHLETTARVDVVALDKTGTLTEGRPRLTDVEPLHPDVGAADLLHLAARVEAASEHPLARPVVNAATARGLDLTVLPTHVDPVPGRGVVAVLDGKRVTVGHLDLATTPDTRTGTPDRDGASDRARQTVSRLAAAGRTPMVVTRDGMPLGVLAVADRVRPGAAAAVRRLRGTGVRHVVVLTGDAAPVARSVADQVGIDDVRAGLLPQDKLDAVETLRSQGRTVAMVGDGVNDAPALAVADVGVAMGAAGSAVAIETADLALMDDRLDKLPRALRLARRTVRTVRVNVVVALVTVAALLAGVLFGGVTMAVGMAVHEASVLLVVANAMRLLRPAREPDRSGRGELDERVGVDHADAATGLDHHDARVAQQAQLPAQ